MLLPESDPLLEAFPEDANPPSVSAGHVNFVMPMIGDADPGSCSNALIARRARVSQLVDSLAPITPEGVIACSHMTARS